MMSTLLCYVVVQIPVWIASVPALSESRAVVTKWACFAAMLVCIAQLVVYIVYQIAKNKLAAMQHDMRMSRARTKRFQAMKENCEYKLWKDGNLSRKQVSGLYNIQPLAFLCVSY